MPMARMLATVSVASNSAMPNQMTAFPSHGDSDAERASCIEKSYSNRALAEVKCSQSTALCSQRAGILEALGARFRHDDEKNNIHTGHNRGAGRASGIHKRQEYKCSRIHRGWTAQVPPGLPLLDLHHFRAGHELQ